VGFPGRVRGATATRGDLTPFLRVHGCKPTNSHSRVLRSHPLLAPSAIEAVKQWEYEPLVLNGKPHPFVLTVTVSYHLS
jgi:hypothetical protein